ncbi:MAG: polysaccharide deacetylase family protein, partial [Candidatus Omnitrophica bacterium]|nr:polysaccharide deacetylase family protein [Candidatus Omnitrophota bacterium]
SSQLISIGCHCRSHVILSKCSKDQTFEEIKSSKNRIEEKTGRKCDLFSYPNGKSDDFNIETVEILKFLNFSSAVTTIIGANNHKSDLYQLNRLPITGQGNIASFKRTLNPISRTLRKLKNSI